MATRESSWLLRKHPVLFDRELFEADLQRVNDWTRIEAAVTRGGAALDSSGRRR
jgi:hypothetical protein